MKENQMEKLIIEVNEENKKNTLLQEEKRMLTSVNRLLELENTGKGKTSSHELYTFFIMFIHKWDRIPTENLKYVIDFQNSYTKH